MKVMASLQRMDGGYPVGPLKTLTVDDDPKGALETIERWARLQMKNLEEDEREEVVPDE